MIARRRYPHNRHAVSMLAATARYAAFLLIALVGPGLGLQRLAGVAIDPALVLPLGIAFAAGAYWLSLVTGIAWLFPIAVVLATAVLAWRCLGPVAPGPSLRGAIAPALALVALLAVTQYRWNRMADSGEFLLDNALVGYDTSFHVGLVRELVLGYPPQVPGVSGFPLGYHLGTDLVRAAALRWAAVDPYDSISRFDVTMLALALLLAVRAAAARLGLSPRGVALAGWTLVATDFSFAFAFNAQAHWWTDLLRGNVLISLALANPVIPALALALGALIALSRAMDGEGRGWWAVSCVLAVAVPFFKVFLGAHLALGLLVALARTRRREVALVLGLVGIATLVLALGQGGRTVAVTLAPLDLVRTTRESLGLVPLHGVRLAGFALLWIAASLGLRMAGLPAALRALREANVIGPALAAMALAAWPLGLLFRVSAPEMLEGQKAVNDAAYLVEQGGPLLWLFTAGALARWMETRPVPRWAAMVAVALLALPSTAQFAIKKAAEPPDPLPAPMVRAMRALAADSRPGDVVLQRPGARFPPAPVILIGRRVPYERFTPWLTQFAPAAELEARHEVVFRFFHTTDADEAMAIARGLGARHVVLYGRDRVQFDPAGRLVPIHEEEGARVYRILS
jgi:hypothetical protein